MKRAKLQTRFLVIFALFVVGAQLVALAVDRAWDTTEARDAVRGNLRAAEPVYRRVLDRSGNLAGDELKPATGLDFSVLARRGEDPWQVVATTLPANGAREMAQELSDGRLSTHVQEARSAASGQDSLMRIWHPEPRGEMEVLAVLQRPVDPPAQPWQAEAEQLGLSMAAGLFLAAVAGSLFTCRIVRRIRRLSHSVRRIASGDYGVTTPVPAGNGRPRTGDAQPASASGPPAASASAPDAVEPGDELDELAVALVQMRADVASREGRIMNLAYRDTLTGLPNRALFNERLQQAIGLSRRLGQTLSVLIMDLDQFKYVNDTLGHHTGDLLLNEVAARLHAVLRRDCDTVARLGGDEFAILLPTEEARGAETVARAVLQALDRPMTLEGHLVDVRASIGIAVCPEHGEDLAELLRRADVAMYTAKRNSTGFAVYDVRYDQHSPERLTLMGELRRAVEQSELMLVYQPKVPLAGRHEKFVEALLRWRHPERGLVMPADFIPFAEQTGYIKTITMWVLNEAVRQCSQWRNEGLPINVSINISARDLLSPELPQRFAEMLMRHDCDASGVWLEITESAIFDDPGHAVGNLVRLRALGCRISIDDYGTGYSSLAYLKRLPVDELKIDRSFVSGMVENHHDEVIVRSTIELAHNLGLRVVAEGVETQAMLRRLKDLNCDMAQGFLMSKPISASEITAWMRDSPWVAEAPAASSLSEAGAAN